MACCLPTCAQGSSAAVAEFVGNGAFLGFWVLLGGLVHMSLTGSADFSLHVCRIRATLVCLSQGALSSWPSGVHWFPLKCAWKVGRSSCHYVDAMLHVLALVRLPSLHGYA